MSRQFSITMMIIAVVTIILISGIGVEEYHDYWSFDYVVAYAYSISVFVFLGGLSGFIYDRKVRHARQRERQHLQDALALSNARFEQLAIQGRTMAWEIDAQGLYTYVSAGIQNLSGYTAAEAVGHLHFFDLHPEEGRDDFRRAAMKVIRDKEPFQHLTNPIQTKSGNIIWVETSGLPLLSPSGELLGYWGMDRDVTAMREANQKLADSEERYRVIFEGANEAILVADVETMSIVYGNASACEMLGYPRSELIHLAVLDMHPPEIHEQIKLIFASQMGGQMHGRAELPCLRRDGRIFDAAINSHVFQLNGRMMFVGFFTDVTLQRRRELVIERSQTIAQLGSWEQGFGDSPQTWSPEMYRITGISENYTGDLLDEFLEHVHPEDRGWLTDRYRDTLEKGGNIESMFRLVMPSGMIKWVELRGETDYNAIGTPTRIWGTVQDITERRRTEEAMRLHAAALEAAANGIVITGKDGRIEWANPAFAHMSGYPAEESLGALIQDLQISYEHPEEYYNKFFATINAGEVWSGEFINRRKDGTLYTEYMTVTPILNEADRIEHFLAVKQDISAQKSLEQQFLQAQKMETVGRLAGGVAHDFNNLINVILGYTELTLDEIPPDTVARENLNTVIQAAEKATNLTRQLLAFSRKQSLAPQVIDVALHLHSAERMLGRLMGEDIELRINCDEHLPPVYVDPGQLEQVIMNLVVNARDAMAQGGVIQVRVEQHDCLGELPGVSGLVAPGRYVCIRVKDNGAGIPRDILPHIFEPFFTTKANGKGTGLGLATVHGIVTQSGGVLGVASKQGKGTTFRVYLPAAEWPETEEQAEADTTLPDLALKTIVIVEDDGAVRELSVRILNDAGCTVHSMERAELAREFLAAHPRGIDLLLTDVILPGMSGPQLAELCQQSHPQLPILFMSGYTDDRLSDQGVLRAEVELINKPFTAAQLKARIAEVLNRHRKAPHQTEAMGVTMN